MTDFIIPLVEEDSPLAAEQNLACVEETNARYFAIVPCAGSGQRAAHSVNPPPPVFESPEHTPTQLPKQYWLVNGRPMVWHTLATLTEHPKINKTLLVLSPDDPHFNTALMPYCEELTKPNTPQKWEAHYCGGKTRQASVINGLAALAKTDIQENDWVLVHDAARPGLNQMLLDRLINEVSEHPIGGLLALPVADTLKRATRIASSSGNSIVDRTINRTRLWQAQTPQMFRFGILQRALQQAQEQDAPLTDEASAIELLGYQPLLITSTLRNLKVTYASDIAIIQALLNTEIA